MEKEKIKISIFNNGGTYERGMSDLQSATGISQ